jgi:flagellar L-ring protein precursor FlgH
VAPRLVGLALVVWLAGCASTMQRLSDVGNAPAMNPELNPAKQVDYTPVSFPQPLSITGERLANSLWRPGARAFFKDQRAGRVGDILTVIVDIDDQADLENETTRSRDNDEDAQLPSFLGYETSLGDILPQTVDPTDLVDFSAATNNSGEGEIGRSEQIRLRVAAVVTQVLPNGNLVIYGRQEIRVNHEVRELAVKGVIRPEDVSSTNAVPWDKVAEARIVYGGRGVLSDVQQPRYGQQLFDILFPF